MTLAAQRCDRNVPASALVRWCKFNLVGGIGILVQVGALYLLESWLHFKYLAATAIAVEAAVVHNFVWHERFTWADRTKTGRRVGRISGAEALNSLSALIAALKRCATQRLGAPSLRRLLRFHLGNGAISILGNLALMKLMVGLGHMNYLLANAVAIAVCSVANFGVSEVWVFGERS